MSMTKEEAKKHIVTWFYSLEDYELPPLQVTQALQVAISALKGPTREQVEKVWRGEWKGVPKIGVYDMACSKCGYSPGIRFYSSEFCPHCGAPMTDEAVEMVIEKINNMEEMTNEH